MKYKNFGLLLMLIVLSLSTFKCDEYDAHYDDDDEYDFDEYIDYDNTTSVDPENSKGNSDQELIVPSTTTTQVPKKSTSPTISPTLKFIRIETTPKAIASIDITENIQCPEKCKCTDGTQFIDCSKAGLITIPKNIPSDAMKIDLSENSIEKIEIDDFPLRMKTRDLILSKNKINKIDDLAFKNFLQVDTIDLSSNLLKELNPDTFEGTHELSQLILKNNPISLPSSSIFLNLPDLTILNLDGCNLTAIPEDAFKNLSGLTGLYLADNDFKETINAKAFEPLKNLGKLEIGALSQDVVYELCVVLTSIDVITTDRYDISCFELVSGSTFDESTMTNAPKPEIESVQEVTPPTTTTERTITKTTTQAPTTIAVKVDEIKTTPKTTTSTMKQMNVANPLASKDVENQTESTLAPSTTQNDENQTDNDHYVNVSSESVKTILIAIIIIALAGLAIGLLCRSDVMGIKTKLCRTRTRRPPPTDQVSPAEEVPLNKVTVSN